MIEPKEIQIECVGYSIAADWYEGSNDQVWLDLISFTSDKSRYQDVLSQRAAETGCSILCIDYTGHGKSPFDIKDLMPAQNFMEVMTAYEWIKENHPNKTINVLGNSYGCFMAAQLLKYRTLNNLILRAPALYEPNNFYTRWRDSDTEKRHEYRQTADNLDNHPVFRTTSNLKGRALVVTHSLDDICPLNSTMPFVKAFNAEHWVAEGFKHSFKESDVSKEQIDSYNKKINDWIKE